MTKIAFSDMKLGKLLCISYKCCIFNNPFTGDFTVTVSDINGLYFLFFSR